MEKNADSEQGNATDKQAEMSIENVSSIKRPRDDSFDLENEKSSKKARIEEKQDEEIKIQINHESETVKVNNINGTKESEALTVENDKQIDEKDEHVNQNDKPIDEKDEHVNQNDKPIDENDEHVNQNDKLIDEKNEHVNQNDKSIAAKDKHVDESDEKIDEKDQKIDEKDQTIDEKNKITEEDKKIDERDHIIKETESNNHEGAKNEEDKNEKDNDEKEIDSSQITKNLTEKDQEDDNKSQNEIDEMNVDKLNSMEKDQTKSTTDECLNNSENTNKKVSIIRMNEKSDVDILNGVELTVECASDIESETSDNNQENKKPKTKTIIIREEPSKSEVDASSSEEEQSCSYKIIEAKPKKGSMPREKHPKPVIRREKKKQSLPKSPDSDSEKSIQSNSDDEDYSPFARKKQKKTPSPKKQSEGSKSGIGKRRGRPPKIQQNVKKSKVTAKQKKVDTDKVKEKKSSKEKTNKVESKADKSSSEFSGDEKSGNESNTSESNKNNDGTKRKSNRNIQKIVELKKLINIAGIKVKCYKTLFEECKTDADKAKRLREFLHENGLVGNPTIENCKKLKIKNETLKEIQELDTTNIISENRSSRNKTSVKKSQDVERSPTLLQKARKISKKMEAIVDDD